MHNDMGLQPAENTDKQPTQSIGKDLPQAEVRSASPAAPTFPEGGATAWGVVIGCWCTSFASFWIVNSFG